MIGIYRSPAILSRHYSFRNNIHSISPVIVARAYFSTNSSVASVQQPAQPMLSVYFDGGCPMCSKEMALYQRLDAKHNSIANPVINFVDLTTLNNKLPSVLTRAGVQSFEDIVKRIHVSVHVSTSEDIVIKNAEAFVELWKRLPYWRVLARFCTVVPGVLPFANFVYSYFAIRRYDYRQALADSAACKINRDPK
jgi:predicted DCC family thiol-disulfide oxidoreductase YuxK